MILGRRRAPSREGVVGNREAAHASLADVLEAHPAGLDFRDVVWMLKRLLAALGFVHRQGVVHGAVLPPHVLVHPEHHGARLVDWCYAAEVGARVRAMSRAWAPYYAPEIPSRAPVSPTTDIFMAVKCTVALLGGDVERGALPDAVPVTLRTFLTTCLARSAARRPDDAWQLHEELDALLRSLVGKPAYRPLVMPARA